MQLSGSDWVHRFPTSSKIDDLHPPFRDNVHRFLDALTAAGVRVVVADTFRPPERAYLMHFAFAIAHGTANPAKVPLMEGVDIQWVHTDAAGNPDPVATKTAAADMVRAYGLSFPPALTSRHCEGLAIDMRISWLGNLAIADGSGKRISIANDPRDGGNSALHQVGASYGVIKLVTDPPHWSSDGH